MADTSTTLGDLVRDYIAEQCAVLIEADAPLRERGPVIHDTRVAARRLRSTLRTYADLVDPSRADALTAELVWYAGLLGGVRDLEVLQERLAGDLAGLPPELADKPMAAKLDAELTRRRSKAWDAVEAALGTYRYRVLLVEVGNWQTAAPLTEAADVPERRVRRYVKRAEKTLDRRLDRALEAHRVGDPEADHLMHQARKAGKRARYAVELAAPYLGEEAAEVIARRKELQDLLGEHQDSLVAADFLLAEGVRIGLRSGYNAFTYGLLYAGEVGRRRRTGDRLRAFLR